MPYYATRSILSSMSQTSKVTPEGMLILTSLAEGPKHGYAIQVDIEKLTGRHLGPGSLYGSMARLEANGYISAVTTEGPRRPYRLTQAGARALATEVEMSRRVALLAMKRLSAR